MHYWTELSTPIGVLQLLGTDAGLEQILLPEQAPPSRVVVPVGTTTGPLAAACAQLREYFEGRREQFQLRLQLAGTDFQRSVYQALQAIPFGETRSYGELARAVGRPTATRAVGTANGRNPLPIIVPCHRVIAADGGLGGYSGGAAIKRWLLSHEGSRTAALEGL